MALGNEIGLGDAMKGMSEWAVAASMAAVLGVQVLGQRTSPVEATPVAKRVIVVSLEDRKLALVEDGQVKKVYTVAVGKPSTPSPPARSRSHGASRIRPIRTMARPFCRDRAIRWGRGGWD